MIHLQTNPCHRPSFWPRAAALAALLSSSWAPLTAQETAKSPPAARETAEGAVNQATFSELGRQAYERLQQDDMAGAIELLEKQRRAGGATHVDLALLGTLYLETGRASDALETLRPVADSESADPAALYNAGRAALASGQIEVAEGYLERSVERLPLSPAARELGLLRGAQGRVTEAYRLLRAWVGQNLGDLEARIALIAAGLQLGRAIEVGPLLKGLPQDDPKITLLRGQHRSQIGDPQGAVEILETLRDDPPPEMRIDLYRLLADDYIDVGRSSDAVALLDGQLGGDPRLALLLAEAQQKTGDLAGAVATLAPFAGLLLEEGRPKMERLRHPVAFQVALDYARLLTSTDRAADALLYLEATKEADPRKPLVWKSLGTALMKLGRRDEAKEALEKFRELTQRESDDQRRVAGVARDPGDKAIVEAQQAAAKGEVPRALAILRQEIALSPQDVRPRLLETGILVMVGRHQDALAPATATVELFPDHPDALYMRGVIRMGLEDTAAAEQDFRRVLELAPDHVAALNDLAVILLAQGKKDEGQKLLERLLELSPQNQLALDNLKRLGQGGG